jgi:hypothetical protein
MSLSSEGSVKQCLVETSLTQTELQQHNQQLFNYSSNH